MIAGKYENKRIKLLVIIAIACMFIFAMGSIDIHAAAANATGKVNSKEGAFLRKSASTNSGKVKLLKDNTSLVVYREKFTTKSSTAKTKKWFYVKAGTKKGYIRADLVDNIVYKKVTAKTTDTINYRVGAGVSMTRKGVLNEGTKITVVLKAKPYNSTKTWYKIKKGSYYRYVCGDYVTFDINQPIVNETQYSKSGVHYPTLISKGSAYVLTGKIKCNKKMSKVKVGVTNSNGTFIIGKTLSVGDTSVDLFDFDKYITFGKLDVGKYYYRAFAYVDGVKTRVFSYAFTVKKAGGGAAKVAKQAIKIAWPLGTSKTIMSYPDGSATEEFKEALNSAYPDRSKWGKQARAGATCDVFVGTTARSSGYDSKMPRGLSEMFDYFPQSSKWKKIAFWNTSSELENGDIILYQTSTGAHVCIYVVTNGKGYIAEAHYTTKEYGHIASGVLGIRTSNSGKKSLAIYRATS